MVDNRIYSLLKVVEMGSYTKAAASLSLSQPAVSQHIRQIEAVLGVQIFDRTHNRLQLTREGEIIVHFARSMVALQKNMEQTLKNERGQVRSLTIGITHTAESNEITEVLAKYGVSHGNVNITIITDTIKNLYDMLENYEIAVYDQNNQLRHCSRSIAGDDNRCVLTIRGEEGDVFHFQVVYGSDFAKPEVVNVKDVTCSFKTNDIVGSDTPFELTIGEVPNGVPTVQESTDERQHPIYDLQGRRLKHIPSKGMYIRDGKVIRGE